MEIIEIIAKPGKRKTEIIGKRDNKLVLNVKGRPENNEANKEIVKFFSKEYKTVKIISGLKDKKKTLRVDQHLS